jgi:F0F1-type ATP synthase membrane subunit a
MLVVVMLAVFMFVVVMNFYPLFIDGEISEPGIDPPA